MLLLIKYTLLYGIVLMLVALGGMFSEHSGIINIALEGIMVIGGVAGVLTLTLLPACWQYFSLFPLEGRAEGVCVQGAFYELDNATLTPDFPIGVSNEWAKNRGPVTVRIDKGALAVICTKAD